MLQKFCHFIEEKQLFLPSDQILLAVSGGMDSVVMADLFFNAGFSFAIAHCNFQLRENESEEDERFVKRLAERYKVPFFTTRFQTSEYSAQKGISIQMAARELRYSWFEEVLVANKFQHIATAHHRDDVLETILLNLVKGTDLHGLTGIREKAGMIIRPLLFSNRKEIQQYAEETKLSWREDSSNRSTKYQRNYIRHKVIPLLEHINPAINETFELTLEKLKSSDKIYSSYVQGVKTKAVSEKESAVYIRKDILEKESEGVLLLFEILREFGFNFTESKNLFSATQTGKRITSPEWEVVKDREYFILTKLNKRIPAEIQVSENQKIVELENSKLSFLFYSKDQFNISASQDTACLDREKLEFPLKIRDWKEGDYFIPFGMKGKKKLSDFLTDQKIPLNLKQRVKVLVSGEIIAWVIGYRIDDRFRIKDDTQKILEIRKQNL